MEQSFANCSEPVTLAPTSTVQRNQRRTPVGMMSAGVVELSSGSIDLNGSLVVTAPVSQTWFVHTSRKSADGSIHVYADSGLKDAPLRRYSRSSSENE
jgi:hypothetical protein